MHAYVHVCVREREGGRERGREGRGEREREGGEGGEREGERESVTNQLSFQVDNYEDLSITLNNRRVQT